MSRRRGDTLRGAIFDAVVDLLASGGYGALTMEGVAAAARTGKASLYRRWLSKEDLVVDALRHRLPLLADVPDTGSLRTDLLSLLNGLTAALNGPTGCAVQALLSTPHRHQQLIRSVHLQVVEPRRRMMAAVVARAVERGEAPTAGISPLVADVGPALVVHALLTNGPPVGPATVEAIVDQVLLPLLTAPAQAAGATRVARA